MFSKPSLTYYINLIANKVGISFNIVYPIENFVVSRDGYQQWNQGELSRIKLNNPQDLTLLKTFQYYMFINNFLTVIRSSFIQYNCVP